MKTVASKAPCKMDDDGFTLVETLVALALLSLTFAVMAAVPSLATRALSRADLMTERMRVSIAVRTLQKTISRALPIFVRQGPSRKTVLQFHGDQQRLTFVANSAGYATAPGLQSISYEFTRTASKDRLGQLHYSSRVFRPTTEIDRGQSSSSSNKQPMLSQIHELRFEYFGVKLRGEEPRWHASWINQARLPRLVRLSVEFEKNTGLRGPLTVVRLAHL